MNEKLKLLIGNRLISAEKDKFGGMIYKTRCNNDSCSNVVIISRIRDSGKCRQCANAAKSGILRGKFSAVPDRIIRTVRNKFNKPAYILRCPTAGCNGEVKKQNLKSVCLTCMEKKYKTQPYIRSYRELVRTSTRKSIGIDLSYNEFYHLCVINQCHYCNIDLNRAAYRTDEGNHAPMIDRLDSDKPYSKENCVPCCSDCNYTKNKWLSENELMVIMALRQNRLLDAFNLITKMTVSTTTPGTVLTSSLV
jgi:hypothetical protein